MTIQEWLTNSTALLTSVGIDTARLDSLVLLEDVIGRDRAYLLAQPDAAVDTATLAQLDGLIERRASHEPLAYIRGKSEFYGREFTVNSYVLVPRPESEAMIDLLKVHAPLAKYIIDIGTGSGALAITARLEVPSAVVVGIDFDDNCLETAGDNARNLHAQVDFERGDLAEPLVPHGLPEMAVLANLPYVPNDFEINPAARFEPAFAIFGGKDGLDMYRRMFDQLSKLITKAIYIFTESMPDQHDPLAKIAAAHGYSQIDTQGYIQVFRIYVEGK